WPRSSKVTRPGWNITPGKRPTTGSISTISGMSMNKSNRQAGMRSVTSSRKRRLAACLCLLATTPLAWAQAGPDSASILRGLARPVPAATPFVEVRHSPLLKAPLPLPGAYRRPDAATLVREVREPYSETTTIRDGHATLARVGKPGRRFALSRAPELAALQNSVGALLWGDAEALRSPCTVDCQG